MDRRAVGGWMAGLFWRIHVPLRRLLPLAPDADGTAEGSGEANDTVVEGDPAQGGEGNSKIAKVAEELDLAGGALAGGDKVSWESHDED